MQNFGLFLLLLFIIAATLRVDFYFSIVYLFFAVYVLSRVWIQRAAKGLEVQRRFTNHAFCGEQVTVDLILHQTSWLPLIWLQLEEALPVQLATAPTHCQVISLGPRQRQHSSYMLTCRQRGYYPVGPLTLRTGDLLGITRHRPLQVDSEYIIVYPRVVPLQRLGLPTRSPLAVLPAHSPLFEDTSRVIGVRDYEQGDSPRHIHWTATASAGRLLVKRYQPAIARETLICLDLDRENYEQRRQYTTIELAIVAAASIANHIIVHEKLPVGLATEARDPLLDENARFFLPPRSERAHLMSVLEVLARVQFTEDVSFQVLLRRESVKLSWGATLAIITGRASPTLFDTLVYLRRAGFAIALILVDPAHAWADNAMQKRVALLGVSVYEIWRESDLEILL